MEDHTGLAYISMGRWYTLHSENETSILLLRLGKKADRQRKVIPSEMVEM